MKVWLVAWSDGFGNVTHVDVCETQIDAQRRIGEMRGKDQLHALAVPPEEAEVISYA